MSNHPSSAIAGASAHLMPQPLEAARSGQRPLGPIERLRRFASIDSDDLSVIVIYGAANGLVSLAVPVAAQALVNTVASTAQLQPIAVLSVLVLVGLLAAGALRTLQYRVIEYLQQRVFVRTAIDATTRLARLDLTALRGYSAPEMANRFIDVAIVQKAAATLLIDGLSVVLQGAVSMVLLAFYHPVLLAFDVILILFIGFIIFGLGAEAVPTALKESKSKYATLGWLQQIASTPRVFKANSAEKFAVAKTDSLARDWLYARNKHFKILLRQSITSHVLQAVAISGLLATGGALVIRGQLTLGQLVAAELIVTALLSGVAKFGKYLESYYDLLASVDKIGSLIDLPAERDSGGQHARVDNAASLTLDQVDYAYQNHTPLLKNVSFRAAAGQQVAILGRGASGKSTLVDLLYGVRSPTAGQIQLDGIGIHTMALEDVRRDIALVSGANVFNGSVIDNLKLGREHVTADCIAHALDVVSLGAEVSSLPSGVETQLGDNGARLTSSQTARLSIARGIVAKPRILLIDEVLDTLGVEAAQQIVQGIARHQEPMTLIVMTSNPDIAALFGTTVRLEIGEPARRLTEPS
jgi:putative ABC transport system ATP-binding protein